MTETNDSDRPVHRILVPVDVTEEGQTLLEQAAEFAAHLHAELTGVFVEDEDVLSVAALPFSRAVSPVPTAGRTFDPESILREFRLRSEEARKRLASIAERSGLEWSFSVRRGSIASAMCEVETERDLIAVSRTDYGMSGRRVGPTARRVLARSERSVLLVSEGRRTADAICAVYDGTPGGKRALELAIGLASALRQVASVLVTGENTDDLAAEARAAGEPRIAIVEQADLQELLGRLDRLGIDLLILGPEQAGLEAVGESLADSANCQVLVV